MSELSEWKQIKEFVVACRRQWPGAMIVLRPDTDAASRCDPDQHLKPSTRPQTRIPMADEFLEHDLDTPTEHDLDQAYGSKYLSATDVGDRKIRTKIAKVRKEEMRTDDGKTRTKFVLYFEALDKPMVLNATNKDALVDKLGKTPANWIGASVGLFVDPKVTFAGKRVKGLRLRVLTPPAAAAPATKPTPQPTTKPPAAAANDWPEEKGDPGFDPDLKDPAPEFAT
jgi:hypothetical protein